MTLTNLYVKDHVIIRTRIGKLLTQRKIVPKYVENCVHTIHQLNRNTKTMVFIESVGRNQCDITIATSAQCRDSEAQTEEMR